MRQSILLSIAFSSYFLVFTAGAQTVQVKGTVREEIPVKEGKIIVYLPDDIRSGDMITGTVIAEPSGNTEKEKNRNLAALEKYKLSAGAVMTPVSGQRQSLTISPVESGLSLSLFNENNAAITSIPVTLIKTPVQAPPVMTIPSHALTGSAVRITGPFDGDPGTTQCRIDGKEMEILAESPRQVICTMPATGSGLHNLTVKENGMTTEKKISAVDMSLSSPKTNLRRGEKTTLTVAISGLQDLPSNATLVVTNTSPSTISLSGGNTQVITITPAQTTANGNFSQTFDAQSVTTGNFTVSADLDLPDAPDTPQSLVSYVPCKIGNETAILPANVCDQLKSKAMTAAMSPAVNQPEVPVSGLSWQSTTNPSTNKVLHLVTSPEFPGEFVRFSYRETGYSGGIPVLYSDYIPLEKGGNTIAGFNPPSPSNVYQLYADAFDENLELFYTRQTVFYSISPYHPEIRNAVLDSLRGKINQHDGEINRLEKEKEKVIQQQNSSNRVSDELKRKRNNEYMLYMELEAVDISIENSWYAWSDSLRRLVNALEDLRNQSGGSTDAGLSRERARQAQAAADACERASNYLAQEKETLEKEIRDLENEYQQTVNQLNALVGEKSKFSFLSLNGKMTKNKSGDLGFSSHLQVHSAAEGAVSAGYSLADIPDLKDSYNALLAKLKQISQRHKAARKRGSEIPADSESLKKECAKKQEALAKANEDKDKAVSKETTDRYLVWDINDLCRRLHVALFELSDWCSKRKGECPAGLEDQLNQLMGKCPRNKAELEEFTRLFNAVISNKKIIEKNHKDAGDTFENQKKENDKAIQSAQKQLDDLQEKINEKADELAYARQKEKQEAVAETDRRQAEKARQNRAEQDAIAKLKLVCLDYLKAQMKTEAEQQWLNTILQIQGEMMKMGEEVQEATEVIKLLPKNQKTAQLKRIAKKFAARMDQLLEPLKAFSELQDKVEALKERLNQLMTFLDGDNSPEANARKFGEFLGLLNEGLSAISNTFPILQVFTAYFDFLVQGYLAAVDGAYAAFAKQHEVIVESGVNTIDCRLLIQDYEQSKDINKIAEAAFRKLNFGIITPRSNEEKRILMLELQKALLKKLTDCCMRWAIMPG